MSTRSKQCSADSKTAQRFTLCQTQKESDLESLIWFFRTSFADRKTDSEVLCCGWECGTFSGPCPGPQIQHSDGNVAPLDRSGWIALR